MGGRYTYIHQKNKNKNLYVKKRNIKLMPWTRKSSIDKTTLQESQSGI